MAGAPLPLQCFGRLLASAPGLNGTWPLQELCAEGGRLVVAGSVAASPPVDEELSVEGPVADQAPLLRDRQVATSEKATLLGKALLTLKHDGPYGLVPSGDGWRVAWSGDLQRILPALWGLPIFSSRYFDTVNLYTPTPDKCLLTLPSGVDELALISVGGAQAGRLLVRRADGSTAHLVVDNWVLRLEFVNDGLADGLGPRLALTEAGPTSVLLVAYPFAQPVHADRLVPLEVAELATPLESQTKLVIEGREGEVLRQSLDGRVLIRLSSQAEEETFAGLHRRLGARLFGSIPRAGGLPARSM